MLFSTYSSALVLLLFSQDFSEVANNNSCGFPVKKRENTSYIEAFIAFV